MRTDACVAFVACPVPSCKAPIGDACFGSEGNRTVATHWPRRHVYTRQRRKWFGKTRAVMVAVDEPDASD